MAGSSHRCVSVVAVILRREGELCGYFHCLAGLALAFGWHRFDAVDLEAA